MKKILSISGFLFYFLNASYAQEIKQEDSIASQKVFTVIDKMPEFRGGEAKLLKFLKKKIKYPFDARKNNIEGIVYATFIIDEKGKITETRILKGIGWGCDEEVLRVINSMPDWKPGMNEGKPVKVQYNIPISFHF